jgi:hypothetical protein
MRVADALDRGQRILRRQLCAAAAVASRRRPGQHRADRGRDQLDVAELLRRDVGDEVIERTRALRRAAEVEGTLESF